MMRAAQFIPITLLAATFVPPAGLEASPLLEDERFGVMTHFAHGWEPSWIPAAAQASLTEIRDELYWQTVEPEKGKYVFPRQYESYMGGLEESRVDPLIVLSFGNKNYDHGDTPCTDDGIAAYARYAVEVLRHYGRQIKAVEIWNEYNGTFCKGPATRDRSGTYLRMLRAAYAAIKRERPDVTVVGGATSGIPLPYWDKLLSGGALDFMDALSVHPYRYDAPPEGIETEIAGLQALVEKHNDGRPKPIWVTEIGWNTKASEAPGDLTIDDSTQAKFLVRAYALLLSAGVKRVYWYLLHDDQGLNMGLMRDDAQHTPKPAYFAMATMIRQLHGADFVRRDASIPGLYSLVFARPSGEEVRVVWAVKPLTVAASGETAVMDMQGRAMKPAPALALDDSPLFITGPLTGLPPPPPATDEEILTDSAHDFSGRQGDHGWSYGVFEGDSTVFRPLPVCNTTDWKQEWSGDYPFISLSAHDQHPSVKDGIPVSAARRWVSDYDGSVRVAGQFRCGTQGDGVGVSVWVDGRRKFRKLLGGKDGNAVVENFDFIQAVHPGTKIDFAVDPGPATDINFDAAAVSATIFRRAR